MIGMELGGRYELLARVGGGGMAIVYKAMDQLLGRYVAIKVLRQQFMHDEDFIRRFRREAQSAASLSHPNVVSIYDVGQEEDIHYIVMEYVEGHNLNEIIKDRAPLQVDEAIRYASQICDALDHAHHNGIIHRDIKPHNILIGKNGRVKVTDFGIARAAKATDITQTGSVIGSVHYFSPEHAKGITQGEKSDLYSLGIVLYQMLTNQLPFLGESPISVALKHLQEPVTEPRKANPLIPQSVENIILKSLRKNPSERYQSAHEMMLDLETALSPERINEQKITFTSEEGGTREENIDDQPTLIMPAIRGRVQQDPEDDPWENVREQGRVGWMKPVAWIIVTMLLLFGMWQGIRYVQDIFTVPNVEVPQLVGLSLVDAQNLLDEKVLEHEVIDRQYHETYEANTIISQEPQAGIEVKEGRNIELIVSLGPEMVTIPDMVELQVEEAIEKLKELGFTEQQIHQDQVQDEAEIGVVLRQTPAAKEKLILAEAEIFLEVSEGPGTIDMPEVMSLTEAEAISELQKLELENVTIIKEPDYVVEEGRVFQQSPAVGDPVASSDEITLYVSAGMPEEARETVYTIELVPTTEGQTSTFEIEISDAKGEKQDWGSKTTKEPVTISIPVVVSPSQVARIMVYENDSFYNIYNVTYEDAYSSHSNGDVHVDEDAGNVEDEPTSENVADDGDDQSATSSDTDSEETEQEQSQDGDG